MQQIHELKCWPEFFTPIWDGRKTYEIRNNDRGFEVGDHLLLREWNPDSKGYSGRYILMEITHTLSGPQWGLKDGYIILAIRNI